MRFGLLSTHATNLLVNVCYLEFDKAVVAAGELIVRLKEAVVLLRQHLGGLGVPAVGMAFPGYVGQPNGMGYSEMTWLPVLAGAAGALGAAGLGAPYPYITMVGFSF
ncbi:hypothetical protein SSX86_032461 [Deinandra increscens subsp. villosa]|uniref:Uncharacterized protein n=1 Tax=Deinandra increscens subsp. villosa TaxID=3103831 RepID=A0AAP0C4Y2_9ASTR